MVKRIEDVFVNEKNRLLGFIKSKISGDEDAEDILQDVFYKTLVNVNVLESIDNLIGWMYTVTKNLIIDIYRKKKINTVSIHETKNDISLEELLEDTVVDIEDDYERSLIYEKILEAIDGLPKGQKEVFIDNEMNGISFKEMSEKTGISINTLLARKRYAVLNLKKKLQHIKDLIE